MGSLIFKQRERQPQAWLCPQIRKNNEPEDIEERPIQVRRQRPRQIEVYDPAPIFRKLSPSKMAAIDKSPLLKQLIYSQHWFINPEVIEHLRIFDVFKCIEASSAHTLTVELYHNVASRCTAKLHSLDHSEQKQFHIQVSKDEQLIIQQYSEIYASLFNLQFLKLRKLVIKGHKNGNPKQSIVSLEVLQYLESPCLQELHADGHNLVSINFLKKCHWSRLTTLSLRQTKIADSSHFASVLPCITNSKHLQTLNLQSKMSPEWFEISWLVKMGFDSAQREKARLDSDDDYYYANNQKVLRRVEFGIFKKGMLLRDKHAMMIRRKFNNSYFDNPLVLW